MDLDDEKNIPRTSVILLPVQQRRRYMNPGDEELLISSVSRIPFLLSFRLDCFVKISSKQLRDRLQLLRFSSTELMVQSTNRNSSKCWILNYIPRRHRL